MSWNVGHIFFQAGRLGTVDNFLESKGPLYAIFEHMPKKMPNLKHIEKKFVLSYAIHPDHRNVFLDIPPGKPDGISESDGVDVFNQALIITADNTAFASFTYKHGAKTYLIPEPDYVCLNFDAAYIH